MLIEKYSRCMDDAAAASSDAAAGEEKLAAAAVAASDGDDDASYDVRLGMDGRRRGEIRRHRHRGFGRPLRG